MRLSKARIAFIVISVVGVIALLSAIYNWYKKPSVITKTEYVNVPVEKIVVKIKKIEVPVEKVVTYEKEKIIKGLQLPEWISSDEKMQVVADAEISAYEGKTSVVGLLNTQTGEGQIVAKQRPLSLFAFESKKEIGIRYGLSSKDLQQIDIYGRWSFLRIGSVHTSFYAEGNTRPEGKIMLDVGYRW